jgi:peptide/nickel transport system substrate-binding protein
VPAPADGVPSFREALIGEVQRLNPLYADLNPTDADITSLMFEGLVRINEYGEPAPGLAADWVISGDGLEYVFTLRSDVLWHDGQPLSAADVVYTMSILSDPAFDGLPELGLFWRTIEVEALSPVIVRFRLTQPLASFLSALTVGLLPEHALRGTIAADLAAHPFNLSPIGTGPYQLEALRSTDGTTITQVDLRAAPNYARRPEAAGRYSIQRVSFVLFSDLQSVVRALSAGTIDGYTARDRTERLAVVAAAGVNTHTTVAPAVGMLLYNWQEPEGVWFFNDLRARTALMRAINRTAPVEAHLTDQAIVATSPMLPNSWAFDDQLMPPAANPPEAQQLMLNANINTPALSAEGVEDPQTVSEIYAFSILVPQDAALERIAQEIAAQWAQLRLNVRVEAVPHDVYQQRLEDGDFTAVIAELVLSADPDPFAYFHVGQYPDGRNYGAMADDRLSELLERARRDSNGINRIQLYREFQRLFTERAVAIPLYYPLFTYVTRTRVEGVQLGFIGVAADRFRTIGDWTLIP